MGCCSTKTSANSAAIGRKLNAETILKPPPAVETIRANDQLLERMRQVSAFKCQVVSPLHLHNHLVYAREAMKAQEILIFNIG